MRPGSARHAGSSGNRPNRVQPLGLAAAPRGGHQPCTGEPWPVDRFPAACCVRSRQRLALCTKKIVAVAHACPFDRRLSGPQGLASKRAREVLAVQEGCSMTAVTNRAPDKSMPRLMGVPSACPPARGRADRAVWHLNMSDCDVPDGDVPDGDVPDRDVSGRGALDQRMNRRAGRVSAARALIFGKNGLAGSAARRPAEAWRSRACCRMAGTREDVERPKGTVYIRSVRLFHDGWSYVVRRRPGRKIPLGLTTVARCW